MNGRFWTARVDGTPEVVIDAAAVAQLVRRSPLGVEVALNRLRQTLPASQFMQIRNLVAADPEEQG